MAHNKLYRNFIILQEDENNASSGDKAVSGYSKIEAKGDKCKITFYAQNLKKEYNYSIVLICYKKDTKQIIDMGPLLVSDNGKGEASKEYHSENIAGINMSFDKISGAGICKNTGGKLVFMLYGFMNGEKPGTGWKNCPVIKSDDKKSIVKPKEEEKPKKVEKSKKEEKCKDKEKDKDKNKDKEKDKDKEDCKEKCKEECKEKCDEKDKIEEQIKINMKCKEDFECYERSIEEANIDPDNFKLRGGVGNFFENIAKGFEEVKGCFKEIKYCKWYKVPVNTIDDMCDAKNHDKHSIVYNPMINYYPYIIKNKQFLIGYKCDNKGNLKHIIYAIKGRKNAEDQPYMGKSGFVTWIKGKENDGNGYWLMFYDYKKATVVVPTK